MRLQIEVANNGESEHANSSDADQMDTAFRKMVKEELKDMLIPAVQQVMGPIMENLIPKVVIHTFKQDIGPMVEDLISKVVKEEIPSALEKFLACHNRENLCDRNSNETTASRPRGSELKFLDEVSDSVLTGKEIKGKGGNHIKVALVDNVTGRPVDSGSEASAKVEIFLEVGQDNNADSIDRENDKTKPHFPKPVHVSLKQGIGFLSNVKLGHGSRWIKSCKCRLGARVVSKFDGSSVKEAWTESFKVLDSRGKLYEKHYPPSLTDDVWRLDHIGKDGAPCKRLHEANVTTVEDFLFLLSIDSQKLQKIVGAGAKKWEFTVNHALECKNNDREMRVYCSSSSESINGVVFDVLVHLKGVLCYNRFVPIEYANEAEKDEAKKLLASAFKNQKDITLYEDETSLLHKYPSILSNSNATNSAGLDGPDDCNRSIIGNIDRHDPTQPGPSSHGINPSIDCSNSWSSNATNSAGLDGPDDCNRCIIENIDRHDPTQPGTSSHGISPSIDCSNSWSHFGLVSCKNAGYSYRPPYGSESPIYSDDLGMCFDLPGSNGVNLSEIDQIESHYDQRSIAGSNRFVAVAAVAFVRLFTRVRVESFGDSQVKKRQRRH